MHPNHQFVGVRGGVEIALAVDNLSFSRNALILKNDPARKAIWPRNYIDSETLPTAQSLIVTRYNMARRSGLATRD